MIRSESWSHAHQDVNDRLSDLLNAIRDCGYNPSMHIHYDHQQGHLAVDEELLKHAEVARCYKSYVNACIAREQAVEEIQKYPKVDLGFKAE